MDRALVFLCSPAASAALVGAILWIPASGYPTWAALARGRVASTLMSSVAVGLLVFTVVRRLGVGPAR